MHLGRRGNCLSEQRTSNADSARRADDVPIHWRGARDIDRNSVSGATLWNGTLARLPYVRGGPSEDLTKVGTTLIDNLGLLFVPAGTAIVAYGALLARDGVAIAAALFASTIAAVIVSGVIAASGASTARAGELAP
jgi:LrgA family